jgi:hypothetical protein
LPDLPQCIDEPVSVVEADLEHDPFHRRSSYGGCHFLGSRMPGNLTTNEPGQLRFLARQFDHSEVRPPWRALETTLCRHLSTMVRICGRRSQIHLVRLLTLV